MTTNIVMLYVTCISREQALEIAHMLVSCGLVACANLVEGVTSVYRWQGEVREDCEVLLLAKTTAAQGNAAIAAVQEAHSYEIPCITLLPVVGGNTDYFDWIKKQVT